MKIKAQSWKHIAFYILFGLTTIFIYWYYLTDTTLHFTSPRQFPSNSFIRYPLSIPIFLAETFSFAFALYFLYVLLSDKGRPEPAKALTRKPPVAFCIPVYNEPFDIVDRTLTAVNKVNR